MGKRISRIHISTVRSSSATVTQSKADKQESSAHADTSTAGNGALALDSPAGCAGSLEQELLQEVVSATYWFDADERGKPYSVAIKFSGRRVGITGKPEPRDRFVRVETVDVVPSSGPVSVTTWVYGVNPGEWSVTAEPIIQKSHGRVTRYPKPLDTEKPSRRRPWRWPTRPVSTRAATPVKTQLVPFASAPGIYRFAWPALVMIGVVVGLAVQAMIVARAHLDVRAALVVSLSASVAGYAGAKAWYLALHRRGLKSLATEGLCIQGFLVGAAIILVAAFAVLRLPVGTFLDAATPGLFLGIAIGRPGCIFAGCCSGRPTASRWGVWASDRRVGTRRVPTQLLEALVGLAIGIAALILVLHSRPALPGAIFVGALAAYTFFRQLLLPFRAEPRKSSIGPRLTMAAAALVLIADILFSFLD